jgi:hypothetical protein
MGPRRPAFFAPGSLPLCDNLIQDAAFHTLHASACIYMKYLLPLAAVLFFATAISAQSKPNSSIEQQLSASGSNATVNFDANSKVTTLKGVAENFTDSDTKRAGVRAMNFAVGAIYAGDKIERSLDPLTLSIWIMSGGKHRFDEDHSLVAVMASERTELGTGRYTARRDGMEYLNFNLTREQITNLADASTWIVGGKQFAPTGAQKKLLRDILAATQSN